MTLVHRLRVSGCRGVLAATITALGACESTPVEADLRLCDQTYEFGNYGCTDISGQVVGSGGQPLPDILVYPHELPDQDHFDSPSDRTDANGRFGLRLHRMYSPPPMGEPDKVSLYVLAVDLRSADASGRPRVMDSVLVQVTVAPVGAMAPHTAVELRLSAPR